MDQGSSSPPSRSARRPLRCRAQDELIPALVLRIEQVHWLLGDELPDRSFTPADAAIVERRIRLGTLDRDERDDRFGDLFSEHPGEPIAGRPGGGAPVPVSLDDLAQADARLVGDRLQRLEQQRPPPGQELSARVELNAQQDLRR